MLIEAMVDTGSTLAMKRGDTQSHSDEINSPVNPPAEVLLRHLPQSVISQSI